MSAATAIGSTLIVPVALESIVGYLLFRITPVSTDASVRNNATKTAMSILLATSAPTLSLSWHLAKKHNTNLYFWLNLLPPLISGFVASSQTTESAIGFVTPIELNNQLPAKK